MFRPRPFKSLQRVRTLLAFPRGMFFTLLLALVVHGSHAELQSAKEKEPPTKSIRGHVTDRHKNSIVGAKVFIKNLNKKTTTVLVTDQEGLYSIFGLDPKADYEVHAEYGDFVSERRTVSSFLNRHDNVFNFELVKGGVPEIKADSEASSNRMNVELRTLDQVKILGNWYTPAAKSDHKFPAVLLLHGFGEDRRVWEGFISEPLMKNKYAVLNIDLRGHGASVMKGDEKLVADRNWLTDPSQFPLDLDAAIQWLRSREEVDQDRIAVIGCSVGANLAFLASGKYEVIRSAVALSGNPQNAQVLAKGVENFQPHSILFIATQRDNQTADFARQFEKLTGFPVRVQVYEDSDAHGSKILQEIPDARALILDWLKNTL